SVNTDSSAAPRPQLQRRLAVVAAYLIYALAVGFGSDFVRSTAFLVVCAGMIVVLPMVSYRWYDVLLLFLPIYNIFFFGKIVYRAAYLPYGDWPVRFDERDQWVEVDDPTRPGTKVFRRH
ncbi:MAG TPA: hypothetical protein VGJ28_17790, partial [Micromonosporaceae bacterium]